MHSTSTGTPVLWAAWWDLNSGNGAYNGIRYLADPISSTAVQSIPGSHQGTDTQDPGQRVALADNARDHVLKSRGEV